MEQDFTEQVNAAHSRSFKEHLRDAGAVIN